MKVRIITGHTTRYFCHCRAGGIRGARGVGEAERAGVGRGAKARKGAAVGAEVRFFLGKLGCFR